MPKIYKEKPTEFIVDVICSRCKKSCIVETNITEGNISYSEINFTGCYGSKLDGLFVDIDLCDNCLMWLVEEIKDFGGTAEFQDCGLL